jgi:hypothetical protein
MHPDLRLGTASPRVYFSMFQSGLPELNLLSWNNIIEVQLFIQHEEVAEFDVFANILHPHILHFLYFLVIA